MLAPIKNNCRICGKTSFNKTLFYNDIYCKECKARTDNRYDQFIINVKNGKYKEQGIFWRKLTGATYSESLKKKFIKAA